MLLFFLLQAHFDVVLIDDQTMDFPLAVLEEIEAKLLGELREEAQKQVLDDLRAKGNIVTIFDGEKPVEKPARR